jgi:ubiquinol-cytochrome c reductase iron-sulfur subunit
MNDCAPAEQLGDRKRRSFLYMSTVAVGALGAGFAVWPLIDSMNPAGDNQRQSLKVDLTSVLEGQSLTVNALWESIPIFIRHRTPDEIEAAGNTRLSNLRDPESDSARALLPRWIVVAGMCTYRKCILLGQKASDPRGEFGGWFCPCCGSHFDTSGRIRKGAAPKNMRVPSYEILNDATLALYSMPKRPQINAVM